MTRKSPPGTAPRNPSSYDPKDQGLGERRTYKESRSSLMTEIFRFKLRIKKLQGTIHELNTRIVQDGIKLLNANREIAERTASNRSLIQRIGNQMDRIMELQKERNALLAERDELRQQIAHTQVVARAPQFTDEENW